MNVLSLIILLSLSVNLFSAKENLPAAPLKGENNVEIISNPVEHYISGRSDFSPYGLILVDLNKDGVNDVIVSDNAATSGRYNMWMVYVSEGDKYISLEEDSIGMNEGDFFFYEAHPDYKLIIWDWIGGATGTGTLFGYEVIKKDNKLKLVCKKLAEVKFPNIDSSSDFLLDYFTKDKEVLARHFIKGTKAQLMDFWKKDRLTQADKIAVAEKKFQGEKAKEQKSKETPAKAGNAPAGQKPVSEGKPQQK